MAGKTHPTLDEALRSEAHDEWRNLGTVKTLDDQGQWSLVEQQSKFSDTRGRIYAHHTPAEGQRNESFSYEDLGGIGYTLNESGNGILVKAPQAVIGEARTHAVALKERLEAEPAKMQSCNALPKDDAALIGAASAAVAQQGGFASRITASRSGRSAELGG